MMVVVEVKRVTVMPDVGYFVLGEFRAKYNQTKDTRAKRILDATDLLPDETLIRVWSYQNEEVWEWQKIQ